MTDCAVAALESILEVHSWQAAAGNLVATKHRYLGRCKYTGKQLLFIQFTSTSIKLLRIYCKLKPNSCMYFETVK